MRLGDLVAVLSACKGDRRFYEEGEIGVVVGAEYDAGDDRVLRVVLFEDGTEFFSDTLLEVISERG